MGSIFVVEDTLSNKISYYHLLFLLFSLPFDMFYSHIILISFAVHTLLHVKKEQFKQLFRVRTLVLQSVFWVSLIGISYSVDKSEGFTELGRQTVIVLMPVLFSLTLLDVSKYRDRLLLGFALCCTLTVCYLFYDALHTIRFYKFPLTALFSAAFTNHNFSNPIEMHATFFALQVGIALVYLVSRLIKPNTKINHLLYAVCCVILAAGLVQLSSKSACAAVLIAIGLVVPFFVLSGAKRMKFMIAGLLITLIWGFFLSRSAVFKERYITDLKEDLSRASANEVVDPRLARWGVALELIGKSPVAGYGSGSETGLLKEAYYNKKLYSSYLNSLNAHNEYLSFLLKSGIIGLLIYLGTLAYGFKTAISFKDVEFLSFMLIIAIVSLSENVLDVDKGTIFYGFFFSFFMFSQSRKLVLKNDNYLGQQATVSLV